MKTNNAISCEIGRVPLDKDENRSAVTGVCSVQSAEKPQTGLPTETVESGVSFVWNIPEPPAIETRRFVEVLRGTKHFFRTESGSVYRIVGQSDPILITNAVRLEAAIRDENIEVIVKDDKQNTVARSIPQKELTVFLNSKELMADLPVMDFYTRTPFYSSDWQLTIPGYNDFGPGERVYYGGSPVSIKSGADRMDAFLNVMAFASKADIANAIAGRITRVLRQRWQGRKPFIPVTARRSHSGKDTIIDFIAGPERKTEISVNGADWAVQIEAVNALSDLDLAVLSVGNIRTEHDSFVASSFLERTITDNSPVLQSSKSRLPKKRNADFLITASANDCRFSIDLLNRAMNIHLDMREDLSERKSAIGNPRYEYLPKYNDEIEAEIHGMIHRWIAAGCPMAKGLKHPMNAWAATVGGILEVNNIEGFLGNWEYHRSATDLLVDELSFLALEKPNQWLQASEWVGEMKNIGAHLVIIPPRFRNHNNRMARELGKILSRHENVKVHATTEDGTVISFTLRKERRREKGNPKVRYGFFTKDSDPVANSEEGDYEK